METMRFMLITGTIIMITLPCTVCQSQDTEPGRKADPNVKWEVRKEYDEHGNLIHYDSSCSRTWKHFDFPGPGGEHAFKDLDSLFGDYFYFPNGMFEHHPFAFGPFSEFMDSLDLDFYLDSSIFYGSQRFKHFKNFPDSACMDPFSPYSLFPDAYMPFDDPHEFFERHRERMERFQEEFTFPFDSIHHFHPEWQQLPRQQKKPARGIEI